MAGLVVLKHCIVEYTDWGVITHFPQSITGAQAHGVPHDTPHYFVAAHRAGYGDDILAYCREHDAFHNLVGQWFTDSVSDVLWCQAHKLPVNRANATFEEIAVQTAQRWVRGAEQPIVGDVDWFGFRDYAKQVLG
jgi:hypothetical protein